MNKKICIVEDDQDLLEAISLSLEDEGFEVIPATKSSQIANKLNGTEKTPDLFIFDLFLSGENGKDLSLQVKSNDQTKDTPVILISAIPDLAKQAQQAKADDFLAKPFEIDKLITKISQILNQSQTLN